MPLGLYMDVHIPRAITVGLRTRGVDVLTAQEDGTAQLPDPELLNRATLLRKPLFTFDSDLVADAVRRQQEGAAFSGVIYAQPLRVTVGQCVLDLELIVKAAEPDELQGQVVYMPL